jgi:hypothetical protein
MIATEFNLIPLATLSMHEDSVYRRLHTLPISYQENLLDKSETRYAFLYYALLTHWPELLTGEFTADELFYNRYYWFLRLSKEFQSRHGYETGYEQQAIQMMESAEASIDLQIVEDLEERVVAEIETKEKEIAVSFSDFSIGKVKQQLGVQLDETGDYFAGVVPAPISSLLQETLREFVPLALAIGTEKARSEFIIAPVLAEIRRKLSNKVSLFSGVEWNVDAAQGLRGECDFLMSLSPEQLEIEAPILSVVEAKKESMRVGIGQCLAEMVAARIFNERHKQEIPTIYGVVTTGNVWKFLRLVDSIAYLDVKEYHINDAERIVGILLSMFPRSDLTAKA